jgi:hypothetical protein
VNPVVWLWERLTGRPYWTGRSAAAEFGPPPASEFADELDGMSDPELLGYGGAVVAAARRRKYRRRILEVAR